MCRGANVSGPLARVLPRQLRQKVTAAQACRRRIFNLQGGPSDRLAQTTVRFDDQGTAPHWTERLPLRLTPSSADRRVARALAERAHPGRPLCGVDGQGADGHAEAIAEHE